MKKDTYMYLYMYLHVYVYKTDAWIPIGKGKGKKGDIFLGKKIIKASNQEVYVDFLPWRKNFVLCGGAIRYIEIYFGQHIFLLFLRSLNTYIWQ